MFAVFGDKGGEASTAFATTWSPVTRRLSSVLCPVNSQYISPDLLGMALLFGLCLLKKITCVYFSVKGVVVSCTLFLDLLGFWWDIKRTIFMVKLSISFKKFSFHTWNTILLHGQKSSPLTLYHTEKWSLFSHSICFFPDFILIFVMPFFIFF